MCVEWTKKADNLNILKCSNRDGPFEHEQLIFWLRNNKKKQTHFYLDV